MSLNIRNFFCRFGMNIYFLDERIRDVVLIKLGLFNGW